MVHIPMVLEKTLGIGFILCFDTLLHELTYMPVNVLSMVLSNAGSILNFWRGLWAGRGIFTQK